LALGTFCYRTERKLAAGAAAVNKLALASAVGHTSAYMLPRLIGTAHLYSMAMSPGCMQSTISKKLWAFNFEKLYAIWLPLPHPVASALAHLTVAPNHAWLASAKYSSAFSIM
jgi:hypothetical protein